MGTYMATETDTGITVVEVAARDTISEFTTDSWFLEGETLIAIADDGTVALRGDTARTWHFEATRALLPAGSEAVDGSRTIAANPSPTDADGV